MTNGQERGTSSGARVVDLERRDWTLAFAVAVIVAVLSLLPLLVARSFYYIDDTAGGAFGQWYALGRELLSGNWPVLNPSAWMAGNYAIEQFGILNPAIWLVGILSTFASSALAYSAAVKIVFLALAGAGVFVLARSFGATREFAILAGLSAPFGGATFFLDATTWVTNLFVWAFFPWVYWGLRRWVTARRSMIPAASFGYLLVTIGYVHGTVALVLLFAALLLESILTRRLEETTRVLVAGAVLGAVTIVTYLPALLSSGTSVRSTEIMNNGFMTLTLNGLAVSATPGAQPDLVTFVGRYGPAPYTYIAWFLPVILLVSSQQARRFARELIGLSVFGGLILLLATGPSELGPLRFPFRLMPWLVVAVLVLASVLLSRALDTSRLSRTHLAVVMGVQLAGFYWAWAAVPEITAGSVAYLVVSLGGVTAYWWLASRNRRRASSWLLIGATTALLAGQIIQFAPRAATFGATGFPEDVATLESLSPVGEGDAIIVGSQEKFAGPGWSVGRAGNLWYLEDDVQMMNLYTPVGFEAFSEDLCMEPYYGRTCSELGSRLFDTDRETGLPLADLLSLDTIRFLATEENPITEIEAQPVPVGWQVAYTEADSVIWVRDQVTEPAGGPVWSSPGLDPVVEEYGDRAVTLSTSGEEGTVVFSRLDWPGYAVEGGELSEPLRGYLLTVNVPEGQTEITVSFTPPSWGIGRILMIGAFVILVGSEVLQFRARGTACGHHTVAQADVP